MTWPPKILDQSGRARADRRATAKGVWGDLMGELCVWRPACKVPIGFPRWCVCVALASVSAATLRRWKSEVEMGGFFRRRRLLLLLFTQEAHTHTQTRRALRTTSNITCTAVPFLHESNLFCDQRWLGKISGMIISFHTMYRSLQLYKTNFRGQSHRT